MLHQRHNFSYYDIFFGFHNMIKYYILCLSISIVLANAVKKESDLGTGAAKKLERKSTDEDFEEIAIQKQLFQDIFTEHRKDDTVQFGHVFENPTEWEQRFEEKDLLNNRHRGKVKWGDVHGAYGEQYWDLNHK